MKVQLSVPELMAIAATRGLLGVGIGLLIGPRLPSVPRKALGLTLLAIGALSTVPLAMKVFGKDHPSESERAAAEADLAGA